MGAHLDIFNICVLSRKSRSVVKENRIMKLYFVNEMIGQLYDHVTLTMWKLSKKSHSPFWEKAHEVKDRPCFACSFIRIFLVFWYQSTLGEVISQAANSVNPDLPAFSLVQATSLWRVLYHGRAKSFSRKLRNEGAKVHFYDICRGAHSNSL